MFGEMYKKYKEKEYIILLGGELIDGRGGELVRNSVVVIKEDKILQVGRSGEIKLPEENKSVCIDITGKTIMPGLIDSHTHIQLYSGDSEFDFIKQSVPLKSIKAVKNAILTLNAGFTTIRDLGAEHLVDIGLRDAINTEVIKGPRMFVTGYKIMPTGADFLTYPPEVSINGRYTFDTPDEARKGVRNLLALGVDTIKIMTSGRTFRESSSPNARALNLEESKIVVEEAHNQGVKVSAHAHGSQGVKIALEAGCDTLEHGTALDDDDIMFMVENGIYLIPTLSYGKHVEELGIETGFPQSIINKTLNSRKQRLGSLKKALNAGVKVAMGTDAGMPFTNHGDNAYEMELLVEAGMTPMEAIIATTYTGAEMLDMENKIGSIEEGKFADLIVVNGDPLEDIKILRDNKNILCVMKSGEILVDRGL